MPNGTKKYKVQDTRTGKTVTFEWSGTNPPTDSDFEAVFSSAGLRDSVTQAPTVKPQAQTSSDDEGGLSSIFRTLLSPAPGVENVVRQLPRVVEAGKQVLPFLDPRLGASRVAQNPRRAVDVGQTALEVGLPFLASPLPPPTRIPASGLLQGTGTLVGEAARSAFVGPRTSLGEQFKSAGESALTGAAGELTGLGAEKLVKKVTSPFAKQVDREALEQVKEMGVRALPSELLDEQTLSSKFYKKFEHIIGGTLTGGPAINRLRTERIKSIIDFGTKKADDLLGSLRGATDIQVSTVQAVEASKSAFRQEASKMYRQIQKETSGTSVDIRSVKAFANRELSRIPEQARVAAGSGGAQASALLQQLESIAKLPDNVPFEDAHFWRSQLLETVRSDISPIGGRVKGTASKMADFFENRMEKAAATVSPDLVGKIRNANKFYREGVELFNNSFLARIAQKDPEQLVGQIIRPQNSNIVKTVKKVVDQGTWQSIKRAEVENWLNASVKQTQSGETFIDGKFLFDKWKKLGEETRAAIFEPAERQVFERYINTVAKLSTKEQGLNIVGQYQIPVLMGSGVGAGTAFGLGSASGGFGAIALGSASMLAPNVVSRMIVSRDGRKLLTEGFRLIPGTPEFARHATRISVFLSAQDRAPFQPAVSTR